MILRDPRLGCKDGILETTLYAITEIHKKIYALTLARMLLTALESPPAPEFPEPHNREDEGKAEEKVLQGSRCNAGADNRIGVVHHDRLSIRAQVGEPPISQKLERKDDRI